MTHWKRKISSEPYLIINLVLAGVVLLIILYSAVYSPAKDEYPVVCIHEKLTGKPCVSCGLSHSFSLIVRGNISEAYDWNPNGLRVFIFFAGQLAMRIVFSIFFVKYPGSNRHLVLYDITVSSMMFIVSFLPFISWIFGIS